MAINKKQTTSVLLLLIIVSASPTSGGDRMNVLFLVSDDMRPQIGAYIGNDFPDPVHPVPHTPNLDSLAKKSLLLKRAYVQQAVCSPSRTSLLTGRRPDTTHVYDLVKYFRTVGGNFTTIPEYFKQQGYLSAGMGKVFHPGHASDHDDPISWTEPYFHAPSYEHYQVDTSWEAVSEAKIKEKPLPDMEIAQHCIETMRKAAPKAKTGEKPFFIAAGFHKPHLPFVFPEKFLDYYPTANVKLPPNPFVPYHFPPVAWYECTGLSKHKDIKRNLKFNTTLPDAKTLELRRAYYSALSYTDSLVGEVIEELVDLGLSNNTIISFWGDHGWQLGEHNEWCKQTNFELATHAPMMIHIPGKTDNGIITEQLTEFVDLFPTLAEAAGLPPLSFCPLNSTTTPLCTEGDNLMPLIKDPKAMSTIWKQRVFSQFPRRGNIMGYTMRDLSYRYTEWVKFDYGVYKPVWNEMIAAELYDHRIDPEENVNSAYDIKYSDIRAKLSEMLHSGWRNAK